MRTVTVVESPVLLPAAPLSVGVVSLVAEPLAGVVSVTAGANLAAVVNDAPGLPALAENVAEEPCTAKAAARTAASSARTRIMPAASTATRGCCRATDPPGRRER